MPASRQRSRSWSQDSGRNRSASNEGLVATAGDAEVDGDDAVFLLADLAAPLALDARGVGALLDGAGLIDEAHGAQVVGGPAGQVMGDVLLQQVAGLCKRPDMVAEELLEGADGDAGVEGDGFAVLAFEVGEESAAVDVEQVEGLGVAAAEEELLQVVGEGRPQRLNLFWSQDKTSEEGLEVRHAKCVPDYRTA